MEGRKKKAAHRRPAPTFPRISEEMKKWSAMLAGELSSWPRVSTRRMFGFVFYYRAGAVFAALPQTRGFDSPSSLLFKFNPMPPKLMKRAEADERMNSSMRMSGHRWSSFRLSSDEDVRDALWWLNQAYEAMTR